MIVFEILLTGAWGRLNRQREEESGPRIEPRIYSHLRRHLSLASCSGRFHLVSQSPGNQEFSTRLVHCGLAERQKSRVNSTQNPVYERGDLGNANQHIDSICLAVLCGQGHALQSAWKCNKSDL